MGFRIFELVIIVALLYVAFRLLRADYKEMKRKVDHALNEENKPEEKKEGA